MVLHFSYKQTQEQALNDIRNILEQEGYIIKEYAPEDGFLFTDYKEFNWGTGRRLLALSVHINDKVTVTGMGKLDIPVTDIGDPNEVLNIKSVDRLSYKIQKKTFLTLVETFQKIDLVRINHWP